MPQQPLIPPESQFCDANGNPFAGGTITTYIPGTDTAKATYSDLAGTVLNTNPIVLDAAGRALIYGTGDYRFVLRDAAGNLIYDQLTTSLDASGFVSTADLNAAVQVETDRAMAAESAEVTRAEAAENVIAYDLSQEVIRAEAEEASLQSQITALSGGTTAPTVQSGYAVTNSAGTASVTFATAFTTLPIVVATVTSVALNDVWIAISAVSVSGFSVIATETLTGTSLVGAACGFNWMASA